MIQIVFCKSHRSPSRPPGQMLIGEHCVRERAVVSTGQDIKKPESVLRFFLSHLTIIKQPYERSHWPIITVYILHSSTLGGVAVGLVGLGLAGAFYFVKHIRPVYLSKPLESFFVGFRYWWEAGGVRPGMLSPAVERLRQFRTYGWLGGCGLRT